MTDADRAHGSRRPPHPHGRLGRHRVRDRACWSVPWTWASTSSPSPTTNASMRPSPAGPSPRTCGLPRRGHRRRGGDDARRPPAGAGPGRAGQVLPVACGRRSPRSTTRAAWPSRPIRSCPYPLCAQARSLRGLLDDRRSGGPPGRARDLQPDLARPAAAPDGRPLRRRARPRPGRQQRRPRPRRRRDRLDLVPGPHRGRPAGGDRRAARPAITASFHETLGQLGTFRRPAPQARPGRPRRGHAAGSARTARGATTATPAGGSDHRATTPATGARHEDRPRLPVHLPGGRRRRPARPVPVREPAPARPRRPDHHRQPRPAALVRGRHHPPRDRLLGADQRLGRHADVLAALHRPGPADAGRGAVRPAPLPRAVRAVPVAVPAARIHERQRRDVPRLCRLLAVVRARQPGHARPCRPAPRSHRGQRRRPPLHRPVLPGRLQGHPQRRRCAALRQRRPDRALAGRDAEPPVRRAARAAQGPAATC